MDKWFVLLFLLSVLVSSLSQILLKRSAERPATSWWREYLNARTMIAYALFFGAALLTMLAYSRVPLHLGPVLESAGYLFVAAFSYFVLRERYTARQLIGMGLIVVGILVVSLLDG